MPRTPIDNTALLEQREGRFPFPSPLWPARERLQERRVRAQSSKLSPPCVQVLLSALAPRPLFDVILSSPPKHAGEPRDLADRGWHAGPAYRDIAALFDQSRERLTPGGRLYVMVSSDSDLDLFSRLIVAAGFRAHLARNRFDIGDRRNRDDALARLARGRHACGGGCFAIILDLVKVPVFRRLGIA